MGTNPATNNIDPATLQQLGAKGGGGGAASFGGPAASTQPALAPIPPGVNPQVNATPAAATPTGQGAGQGGAGQPLLTSDQQMYMALDGVSDPSQLTPMQRGGINTALGKFSGPGSFDNAYYNTPQEFVQGVQGKGGPGGS